MSEQNEEPQQDSEPPSDFLSNEDCDDFRRLPLSFNEMVRAIYKAGYDSANKDAHKCYKGKPGKDHGNQRHK